MYDYKSVLFAEKIAPKFVTAVVMTRSKPSAISQSRTNLGPISAISRLHISLPARPQRASRQAGSRCNTECWCVASSSQQEAKPSS